MPIRAGTAPAAVDEYAQQGVDVEDRVALTREAQRSQAAVEERVLGRPRRGSRPDVARRRGPRGRL
jgi:hypothetical protein